MAIATIFATFTINALWTHPAVIQLFRARTDQTEMIAWVTLVSFFFLICQIMCDISKNETRGRVN
jgi:hypothetical protein